MKLTPSQMQRITQMIFDAWKKSNVVVFKDAEKKVFSRALDAIKADYDREIQLDKDVQKMLDDLERSNPGEFQRHKMAIMLKQKLAKERKIIL